MVLTWKSVQEVDVDSFVFNRRQYYFHKSMIHSPIADAYILRQNKTSSDETAPMRR